MTIFTKALKGDFMSDQNLPETVSSVSCCQCKKLHDIRLYTYFWIPGRVYCGKKDDKALNEIAREFVVCRGTACMNNFLEDRIEGR